MASLHPAHGARLVLEREAVDDGEVRYRVSVYEPEVRSVGRARLDPRGEVLLGDWDREPPAWALVFLERLLKGLPRKHAADGSWPRKISRWRQER